MKRVVILGSTGSVGKNACRVAEALHDRVQVVGIAAKSNVGALAEQAGRLGCSHACIGDASLRDALAAALPERCRALAGPEGLLETAARAAAAHGVPSQLSMERRMACGIGICLGCAVAIRSGEHLTYQKVCKDGPVFAGEEVAFHEEP